MSPYNESFDLADTNVMMHNVNNVRLPTLPAGTTKSSNLIRKSRKGSNHSDHSSLASQEEAKRSRSLSKASGEVYLQAVIPRKATNKYRSSNNSKR